LFNISVYWRSIKQSCGNVEFREGDNTDQVCGGTMEGAGSEIRSDNVEDTMLRDEIVR
jgi:hypothetical protein